MTALLSFVLLASFWPTVRAQLPAVEPSPPDVTVAKHGWSKERLNWERDPFGGTVESFSETRRRVGDERRLESARASGNPGEASRIEQGMRAEQVIKSRQTAPPRYVFLYKATFHNGGQKTVTAVDWDYVFYDAATGQELGRRQFALEEKIGPGRKREDSYLVPMPPTATISAQSLNKDERKALAERVVIVRVTYADGSVWQAQQQ